MMRLLVLAMIADALIGDPKWLWSRLSHPVVIIGAVIATGDKWLNRARARKVKGLFFLVALVAFAATLGRSLSELSELGEFFCLTILLAQRSLADHVSRVAESLRISVEEGRDAVARIVGRDTDNMNESEVARSAIESAAENFSDGVIAPIFWFLVAGLPGILIYKCVNTADSMIGYRTKEYRDFGWASARFDDLLNWLPARLTALLLAVTGCVLHLGKSIRKDAKLHRSPNAGWPETAMGYGLGLALAGPRSYEGQMQDFAWVNQGGSEPKILDIKRAVRMLWSAWLIVLVLALSIAFWG
jgi:adenosylcobinamide-phosphate synthase|tara:strand:- start:182 stop:1084 length:903 start_codon:yes stop_codon:yes gene_type:complete